MFLVRRPVEDELGYLSALHPSSVGALRGALELKSDGTDGHLAHAFLPEIAQLTTVQHGGRRVERFGFDLYRVVKVDVEGVAGTVGEKLRVVLRQDPAQAFQFYFNVVVGGSIRRTV